MLDLAGTMYPERSTGQVLLQLIWAHFSCGGVRPYSARAQIKCFLPTADLAIGDPSSTFIFISHPCSPYACKSVEMRFIDD